MSGSASEREIRDYAAGRLRQMIPGARIIHELVVGGCRADLAAVTDERVTLVEIKSERDTLKRLPEQVRQFNRAAHEVIVIAHERWWDAEPYDNGAPRFVPGKELADGVKATTVWGYPEVADRDPYGAWSMQRQWSSQPEPHAARLLELCWKSELLAECSRHRISASSRTNMMTLIRDMTWHMTGAEIARSVCRQLRNREFPEAVAPIIERIAA